jgi:hypothetical protein
LPVFLRRTYRGEEESCQEGRTEEGRQEEEEVTFSSLVVRGLVPPAAFPISL